MTDDQVRKGDIHITVVATGFDTDEYGDSPADVIARVRKDNILEREDEREDERHREINIRSKDDNRNNVVIVEKEEEMEEIMPERIAFPSRKMESKMIIEEKVQPKRNNFSTGRNIQVDDNDDDELEIPAFIRRKMGK
ncbi:MAG: hypothetical protein GX765_00245 [Candidatus Moranbacteria bacterium]|nr:hypothetical protein [Candidatus Moranbacteria bacterium]